MLKNLNLTHGEFKNQYSLKDFIRQIDPHNAKLKKIEALLSGHFKSFTSGEGFDFNEIREYKIGDDLRHISWNTTAKTGNLHTKEYFSEKEIRTFFLLDISNSMFCGNKLEAFSKLFAFLLNLSCNFSEKIGGLFFSNEIKYYFPLNQSYSQANIMFQTFLNFIHNLNNDITTTSSSTNLNKALEFTKRCFCKKGLIYIISDFINLSQWEKVIYQTSRNQNIYLFQIYDPLDFYLPKAGYVTIIDPETNKRCVVNTDNKTIQQAYSNNMNKNQNDLKLFLQNIEVHHIVIEPTSL